jgi:predicted AlkP superfamily pyrophosphatase or phosphodiesterase
MLGCAVLQPAENLFMKKSASHSSLLVFLCLFLCSAGSSAQQKPQQPAKKPKLLLVVVVDQFRYDYLLRFRADYHGGIARLLENGAVFADARYPQFQPSLLLATPLF